MRGCLRRTLCSRAPPPAVQSLSENWAKTADTSDTSHRGHFAIFRLLASPSNVFLHH